MNPIAIAKLQRKQLWASAPYGSRRCSTTRGEKRCVLVEHHDCPKQATPHLFEKSYDEIISESRRQIAEIEQYFLDVASWNENSRERLTNEAFVAIDADPDGMMRKMRDGLTAMLDRERALGRLKD